MIQISQLKLPLNHNEEDLKNKIKKTLRLAHEQEFTYKILRQSLDARKKSEKKFVYCVHVKTSHENKILKKVGNNNIMSIKPRKYIFPTPGNEKLNNPPVIVGSGPAGLFCGYMLASHGYQPIILERGDDVDTRLKKVEEFWEQGILDEQSNVQFGEGGAGTFSDGKLNTLVKDPVGRNRKVLELFVECGAPKKILYENKPHLGTDALTDIVKNLRYKIQEMGGSFRFRCQMTDILIKNGRVYGIKTASGEVISTEVLVLAIGHSARDTFHMLHERGVSMTSKSFAVGVRVQHPQKMINQALYGEEDNPWLGAAAYKLTHRGSDGRGVYSFCMCPGGYVVDASSESGALAVNGMSYANRDSDNANSALIVTVNPEDFLSQHSLAGVEFQRTLEKKAYELSHGKIPLQLYGDFRENVSSVKLGEIQPAIMGQWTFANLREILPEYVSKGLLEAMEDFEHKIHGFSREDTLLCGVESRTSSPVRIERSETMESNLLGLYPCGEGAGYAGGITSAAMDGLKIAETIATSFLNFL